MRHISCGTLEELRKAESALDKVFTRTVSSPDGPMEYCCQKDVDAGNGEERFTLTWETEDEWLWESLDLGDEQAH